MKKLLTLSLLLLATVSFSFAQSNVQELDFATFESLLDQSDDQARNLIDDVPIVIDFSATWCGPCKAFAPTFDAASVKYEGEVNFYKVDIDAEPELAEFFEVTSIPTVIFIPVSGDLDQVVGAPAPSEFSEMLNVMFGV